MFGRTKHCPYIAIVKQDDYWNATCSTSFIPLLESNGSYRSVTVVKRSFPTLRGNSTKDCGQQEVNYRICHSNA